MLSRALVVTSSVSASPRPSGMMSVVWSVYPKATTPSVSVLKAALQDHPFPVSPLSSIRLPVVCLDVLGGKKIVGQLHIFSAFYLTKMFHFCLVIVIFGIKLCFEKSILINLLSCAHGIFIKMIPRRLHRDHNMSKNSTCVLI